MLVFFDILFRNYNLPIFLKNTVLLPIATLVTRLRAGAFDLASSASLASAAFSRDSVRNLVDVRVGSALGTS